MPIALGVLLVAVLALGFMSMQAMLERLTQEQQSDAWWAPALAPLNALLGVLNRAQRAVWEQLVAIMSRFAGASLHALAHWFWSLEHLAADTAHSFAAFAETVAQAFEHALTVTIPHAIKSAVKVEERLRKAEGKWFQKQLHTERHYVRTRVAPKVAAHDHAIAVTIPGEIARWRAHEEALIGRTAKQIRRRLRAIDKRLTYGALAAVVVKVIARRWSFMFCRTVRKNIGPRLCGLDPDWIIDAFIAAELLSGGLSIRTFARDVYKALQLLTEAIALFVEELRLPGDDYLGGGAFPLPDYSTIAARLNDYLD